ncbi:MAG TPA: hypothetical protein VGI00_24170 [Streptosporangiaceae bacterium]
MPQHPAGGADLLGHVQLGHGQARPAPGAGQDGTTRPDHLGLAEEPHPAHDPGLVGRDQHDLVLRGPGTVVQVEQPGLPVLGQSRGPVGEAGRPG